MVGKKGKTSIGSEFKGIHGLLSKEQGGIGKTHLWQHQISTGNAAHIRAQFRKTPIHKGEAAKQEIQKMLDVGVIEKSESP